MRETRSLLAPVASAAVAVAVAALATGCGAGTGNAGPSASGSASGVHMSSTPSAPSTPGPATPTGSPSSSKPPLTTGGKASLTGTAVRGAEPGCVGLKTADGHSYELAGDPPRQLGGGGGGYQAKLGRVKVTGHFASAGMASHCMMGRIFVVSELQKLG